MAMLIETTVALTRAKMAGWLMMVMVKVANATTSMTTRLGILRGRWC